MIDTIQYIGTPITCFWGLIIYEYSFMESYSKYATGPIYNPINYYIKYNRAMVFFKSMLLKRQRVLLVSSIGYQITYNRPIFSFIFNVCM